MIIRGAAEADLAQIEELYRAFFAEVPPPPHVDVSLDVELAQVRERVAQGLALVATRGDEVLGFALLGVGEGRRAAVSDLYVVPEERRSGVGAALMRAVVEDLSARGVGHVDLEVLGTNTQARSVYRRWGFTEHTITLSAAVAELRERLADERPALSFASIHVQTDDRTAVERAAAAFAPRVGSTAWRVVGPRGGWTALYDAVIDTDTTALVRFAREVSARLGAVVIAAALEAGQVVRLIALERGGIVDEYLSVPEFHGPLAPGDVVAYAANPRVLHRLTGASVEEVRAVARTAGSPAELPPAHELLTRLGEVLGIDGLAEGFGGPRDLI